MKALDHLVWISRVQGWKVDGESVKMAIVPICFPLSNRCSAAVQIASISAGATIMEADDRQVTTVFTV